MARNLFGGTASDVAEDATGARIPNAVGTVWNGPSAGAIQITDLTNADGVLITQLVCDTRGFLPTFYGPDGLERLWVDFGGGKVALTSVTVGERLDAHAAVTTGVHGLGSGVSVVGDTTAQTLTNKTLRDVAMSGTWTGAPNFTGGPLFSNTNVLFTRTTNNLLAFRTNVAGDGQDRFRVQVDGYHQWSDGTAVPDTTLYRNASNSLKTDGSFTATNGFTTTTQYTGQGSSVAQDVFRGLVSGDALSRFTIDADGRHEWGDGASNRDTNLYRSAANTLQTDDNLNVTLDLSVTGNINPASNLNTGAWTSFTPTWAAATTAPALGNGTLVGRYQRIGRTIIFHINLVPGSTTTFGTGGYSFALPFVAASNGASFIGQAHLLASFRWAGQVIVASGASTTSPFLSTSGTDTRLTQMSASVPESFASGNQLRISGFYEAAS